jgi:hypothetical protein
MFISSSRSPNTKTRVVKVAKMQPCTNFVHRLCLDSLFPTEFFELLQARHMPTRRTPSAIDKSFDHCLMRRRFADREGTTFWKLPYTKLQNMHPLANTRDKPCTNGKCLRFNWLFAKLIEGLNIGCACRTTNSTTANFFIFLLLGFPLPLSQLAPAYFRDSTFIVLLEELASAAFGRTVDRIKTLPVLLIVTFRPEFNAPWAGRSHVTSLALNRLGNVKRPRSVDLCEGP